MRTQRHNDTTTPRHHDTTTPRNNKPHHPTMPRPPMTAADDAAHDEPIQFNDEQGLDHGGQDEQRLELENLKGDLCGDQDTDQPYDVSVCVFFCILLVILCASFRVTHHPVWSRAFCSSKFLTEGPASALSFSRVVLSVWSC